MNHRIAITLKFPNPNPPLNSLKMFWGFNTQGKDSLNIVDSGESGCLYTLHKVEIAFTGSSEAAMGTHDFDQSVQCAGKIDHYDQEVNLKGTINYIVKFRNRAMTEISLSSIYFPYLNLIKDKFKRENFLPWGNSHSWRNEDGTQINLNEISVDLHAESKKTFITSGELWKQGALHLFSYGLPVFITVAAHYYARIAGVWEAILVPAGNFRGDAKGIPGTGESGTLWCMKCRGSGVDYTFEPSSGGGPPTPIRIQCLSCQGSGKVTCNICKGKGYTEEKQGTKWFPRTIRIPCSTCASREVIIP